MVKRLSMAARAMVTVYGDRMAARAIAYAGAERARAYRQECEEAHNADGAVYWMNVESTAWAIVVELDSCC